jgi:D-alanyl-D-alanine carboxypeptidase/D-alanyl-D-alanine-endopeptidase (penicillin-binding protein 4)
MKSCLLSLALLLSGCASLAPTSPIPALVRAELARQDLRDDALAFVAYPLDRPVQRLAWQAERSMSPGSTMKLVTAIVALDRVGPNWRGRTELLAAGPLVDGVLEGPLVLRGGADAALDWGQLANLLREARESGIRELRGGVLVDRTRFQPAREDIGLPPFDEAPEFPYNTLPDALFLNANLLTLTISAGADRIQAQWSPAWPGLSVDASKLTLNDKACKDWEEGWVAPLLTATPAGYRLELAGSFPRRCTQRQGLNLIDRQVLTAQALRQLWAELGGTLTGEIREGAAPLDARQLATHLAPPLAEWLRGAMKRSDNPLTRLAYLQLGSQHPQATQFPSTRAAAEAQVRDWLRAHGIADDTLVLDNGSGLSRSERLSPDLLAAMLQTAAGKPYAPELEAGLPLAGVDGTMSRRLKNTAAESRARLKTGTLRDAVGLAGYVTDARGRRWVVAALVNGEQAPKKGRPVLDALIAHLANMN